MATLIVFPQSSDGYLDSSGVTYSTVAAGSGSGGIAVDNTGTQGIVGQSLAAITYHAYEMFLSFDTSVIPDLATVTAASLELKASNKLGAGSWAVNVRRHDWGTSLAADDWQTPANLGLRTLMWSRASSLFTLDTYVALNAQSGTVGGIGKFGATRLVLSSQRLESESTPSGNEYVQFYLSEDGGAGTTNDPRLTVTYSEPAGGSSKCGKLGLSMKLGW